MINAIKAYTFDDLFLIPRYSEIVSRSEEYIDTSVDLGKGVKLNIPIISANMKTVTETKMAETLSTLGGLPIFHRFGNYADQVRMKNDCVGDPLVGASVGVQEADKNHVDYYCGEYGFKVICVDVAHGDHILAVKMTEYIANKYPEVLLISGNVATASGAMRLYNAGADVIKAGIGGGSLCSTRIETGVGVPQMSALEEIYQISKQSTHDFAEYQQWRLEWETKTYNTQSSTWDMLSEPKPPAPTEKRKFKIIADGGIKTAGHISKALVYSDAVMLGSLLAGTEETPGNIVVINGERCKEYVGSSTHKTNHIEGIKTHVKYKGSCRPIITALMEGVRSSMSYQGVDNLEDFKKIARFVEVSGAGLVEASPHIHQ